VVSVVFPSTTLVITGAELGAIGFTPTDAAESLPDPRAFVAATV
jgi:hypothetical protein